MYKYIVYFNKNCSIKGIIYNVYECSSLSVTVEIRLSPKKGHCVMRKIFFQSSGVIHTKYILSLVLYLLLLVVALWSKFNRFYFSFCFPHSKSYELWLCKILYSSVLTIVVKRFTKFLLHGISIIHGTTLHPLPDEWSK